MDDPESSRRNALHGLAAVGAMLLAGAQFDGAAHQAQAAARASPPATYASLATPGSRPNRLPGQTEDEAPWQLPGFRDMHGFQPPFGYYDQVVP